MKPIHRLSSREKELYERIYLHELETQFWFAMGYSEVLGQEFFVVIQ